MTGEDDFLMPADAVVGVNDNARSPAARRGGRALERYVEKVLREALEPPRRSGSRHLHLVDD